MNRIQILAAETFRYSYANYEDHLGVNVRFDRLMPDAVKTLEKATAERWPLARIAKEIDSEPEAAAELLESFKRAKQVIDAENPAESFRAGVRFSIQDAVADGIHDEKAIETLVTRSVIGLQILNICLNRKGPRLQGIRGISGGNRTPNTLKGTSTRKSEAPFKKPSSSTDYRAAGAYDLLYFKILAPKRFDV